MAGISRREELPSVGSGERVFDRECCGGIVWLRQSSEHEVPCKRDDYALEVVSQGSGDIDESTNQYRF